MNTFDIILIIILIISFISGFMQGFLYKLGSLIGLIIGVIIAGNIYDTFGRVFGGSTAAMVISFIVVYMIVSKLIGLAFKMVNRFIKVVDKIPIIKQFNKLLGAILGLFTTVLVLSFAFYFLSKFELSSGWLNFFDGSVMVNIFIAIGGFLSFLLPAAVTKMKSYL